MTVQDERRARLHELVDAAPPETLESALQAMLAVVETPGRPAPAARTQESMEPQSQDRGNGAQLLAFLEVHSPDEGFAEEVAAARELLAGGVSAQWSDDG